MLMIVYVYPINGSTNTPAMDKLMAMESKFRTTKTVSNQIKKFTTYYQKVIRHQIGSSPSATNVNLD